MNDNFVRDTNDNMDETLETEMRSSPLLEVACEIYHWDCPLINLSATKVITFVNNIKLS